MQEVFVFFVFFMSHSISINARQEVQPLRASQCWQVSLGKIELALSVTQDSSYYSAGTAAATRRCEWVNERGVCFVHRQRCKKKKREKYKCSPFTFYIPFHFPLGSFARPIFWLERLNILNSFSLVVFSSRRTVLSPSGDASPGRIPPPTHHHLSGSGQVLRSKDLKRVIPNDRSAV